jgi:hypothetical protein
MAAKENIFNHSYTWLKVLGVAYVIELFYFSIFLGADLAFIQELYGWIFTLVVCAGGLVAGFFLNTIFNFRKASVLYAVGHVIMTIGVVEYFQANWEEQDEQAIVGKHESSRQLLKEQLGLNHGPVAEKILVEMEKEYPEGNYEFSDLSIEPENPHDTSTMPTKICYITYFTDDNFLATYFNMYRVTEDHIERIVHHESTNSIRYKEYMLKRNSQPGYDIDTILKGNRIFL